MWTDINNNLLALGDSIIYTMKTYGTLQKGKIEKIGKFGVLAATDFIRWDGKPSTYYREIRNPTVQIMKLG